MTQDNRFNADIQNEDLAALLDENPLAREQIRRIIADRIAKEAMTALDQFKSCTCNGVKPVKMADVELV
jgi:hypothetical protein